MIVWSRIDSRLIHGQVIEAWLPHLGVRRVVVADDEASLDPLTKAAYGLAIPEDVELVLAPINRIDFQALAHDGIPTLVLFREVKSAVIAREAGLPDGMLNLGNVHSAMFAMRSAHSDRSANPRTMGSSSLQSFCAQ